jgi:uncharacterized protein YsxB (DUF464 family)
MSKVNIEIARQGKQITSISFEGHTETQVCATVSAVVQTFELCLRSLANSFPENINLNTNIQKEE